MDLIVALQPDRKPGRIFRASVELYRRADTGPWRAAIERILTNEPGSERDPFMAGPRYTPAFYERDRGAAPAAAPLVFPEDLPRGGLSPPWPAFLGGVVARF